MPRTRFGAGAPVPRIRKTPIVRSVIFVVILAVIILIMCILLAFVVNGAKSVMVGGAPRRPRPKPDSHVVVDTLNLTHWLFSTSKAPAQISTDAILRTVSQTAEQIKGRFPGRVMYVVKDRESALNDPSTRKAYADAAREHSVYIEAVERYEDPPAGASDRHRESHSARGRDDFYMALLAKKYRCSVLTEDRFRDFDQFRRDIGPFHVYEYSYYSDFPIRDFVNPRSSAYRTLKKPHAVRYAEILGQSSPSSTQMGSSSGIE